MASPTAIPHAERSCHHQESLSSINTSPTKKYSTSPPLVSPLYSGAGRAFATNSNSAASNNTSPTTRLAPAGPSSTWSLASSNRAGAATSPRQEYFDASWANASNNTNPDGSRISPPISSMARHRRATSGSISSLSSALSVNEPPSPRSGTSPSAAPFTGGMALGRVPSLPLSTSYEQAQKRLSTGGGLTTGWGGLAAMRGKAADPNAGTGPPAGGGGPPGGGGMSGLLRKLSISSGPLKSPPMAHAQSQPVSASALNTTAPPPPMLSPEPTSAPATLDIPAAAPAEQKERGRRPSVGMGGKRRPSPMGERLLLGHFSAH